MKSLLTTLCLAMIISCSTKDKNVLYQSDTFTLYKDKVVQGNNTATVLSSSQIKSNYKSPASATFSRLIKFKFSINEKDNELAPGNDHWVVINNEKESPVTVFGQLQEPAPAEPATYLPVNYEYTFKVDMNPVLKQFDEKGYYEAYDGSKVAKADFKGFYIAGAAEPLSWDFVNLSNKGLALKDDDGDGIYTITLKFNPYNEEENKEKEWKLSKDLSQKPTYKSDQPIVDALFNLSLEEALKNIEADSTFRTGAKWGGVWTRDISYSILLAFAYHQPDVAKISLLKKVKRKRIIQDTGSGGAWPVSSDRTTWVLAAWEIYKATGDKDWLQLAYEIIKNTLDDDAKVLFNSETGLYQGESSFLDWREQTYPKWMSNMDIYVSQNLGTNVVHYQAHKILSMMAKELNQPSEVYEQTANNIKTAINNQLWMSDKGYYGQYIYGRNYLTLSPRFEALGEALSVLFDVANERQANSIFEKSPLTAFGVTCIYPQIPGIPPYHNNAIWPFVQAYWNLAAAKAGNEAALNHGLAAIYRAAALYLTNYENMVAATGDFNGTEINSDRMLWSMAGNIAMVHRVFMGINFETNGIRFAPAVPSTYTGKKTLSNFKYRNAVLTISVNGTGNKIVSVKMDGKELPDALLPSTTTGTHTIEIELDNKTFKSNKINSVENEFSLPDPQVKLNGNKLEWKMIEGAAGYLIYKNGKLTDNTKETNYTLKADNTYTEYSVSAVTEKGVESFISEPVPFFDANRMQILEMEMISPKSSLPYVNYSGTGFIETSTVTNKSITINVNAETDGAYLIDFRYSNGSGPWNTDNKCAIRSMYNGSNYVGTYVFPQRGTDEWSDWGWSNSYKVNLKKGTNQLRLVFEEWNTNMNVDVNRAMIDYMRIIKL
jgi:glycogen debranching enzyme